MPWVVLITKGPSPKRLLRNRLEYAFVRVILKMDFKTLVAVAVFCVVCGSVSAVDMSKLKPYNLTAADTFIQEDLNRDGLISVAEVEAVFDNFDSNHDGRESRNEYTQMICATDPDLYMISHYLFDDYDVNGDHHLEKADYDGWHAKLDANHDGNVSQEEFVNYWVALLTHIEQQEAQHQHGNSHEHGHCPGTG